MKTSEVAKRYAKALLAVAKQNGVSDKIFTELQTVATAFNQDPAVKAYFENPLAGPEQKLAVVNAALSAKSVSPELLNTFVLLAEKGRLGYLQELVQAYQLLLDEEAGITRGTVRSAQPLSSEAQKEVEARITQVLKKKIILTYQQDPKLLGGVVAQVGGWTFDDSIDTQLKKLNEELNRRAN